MLFSAHPYFIVGIVLEFIVPTGVVSFIWVTIYKGNLSLTLSIILLDTLIAPFSIPFTLKLLAGTTVTISTWGMMKDLSIMIAIPAVLAMLLHQATGGSISQTLSPKLAPFSKIALILVIAINATKIAPFFHNMNSTLLFVAITILVLAVSSYLWAFLGARLLRLSKKDTVSVTFNGSMRNISAGAVIAAQFFPPDVMFPVIIGTLFQQILAATTGLCLKKLGYSSSGVESQSMNPYNLKKV